MGFFIGAFVTTFYTRIGTKRWKVQVDDDKPGFSFRLFKPTSKSTLQPQNQPVPTEAQADKPVFGWFLGKGTQRRLLDEYRLIRQADQYWLDEVNATR